jgi:hypothetical protein
MKFHLSADDEGSEQSQMCPKFPLKVGLQA